MLFALFWTFVGATGGYIAASMVFAQKLADERARMVDRMRRYQEMGGR